MGAICGLAASKVVRATLKLTIAATARTWIIAAPIFSLSSATATLIAALARFQLITIHWERIRTLARAVLPFIRRLPEDVNKALLREGSAQQEMVGKVEGTIQRVTERVAANKHLAVGAAFGFALGLAKGLKVAAVAPAKRSTRAPAQEMLNAPLGEIIAKFFKIGTAAVRGAFVAGSEAI